MTRHRIVLALVLSALAATAAYAQQWVTDWQDYQPDALLEPGRCYQHPYTDRICVLGKQATIGGGEVLIVQVMQGTMVCKGVPSHVCGISATFPRGVWMPMHMEP